MNGKYNGEAIKYVLARELLGKYACDIRIYMHCTEETCLKASGVCSGGGGGGCPAGGGCLVCRVWVHRAHIGLLPVRVELS